MDDSKTHLFPCFLIALVLTFLAKFCTDFRFGLDRQDNTSIALMADDWALYGDLVWDQTRTPSTKIREIFTESWEGRPLRALEYGALLVAFKSFGLAGGFWLQLAIIAVSGAVFSTLLRRQIPLPLALLGGILATIHPGDTTQAWLATMMAKLGILYGLCAMMAFSRGKNGLSAALLGASFLSYELSPFIFALAPFFRDGGSRRSFIDAVKLFFAVGCLYGAWRAFIFVEAAPDIRLLVGDQDAFNILLYLKTFLTTIQDLVWTTTVNSQLWSLVSWWPLVAGTLTASLLGFFWKSKQDLAPSKARALFGFGILTMVSGAALSFRAAPNAELSIASRHNIVAVFGATLIFLSLIATTGRIKHRSLRQSLTFGLSAALILLCLNLKIANSRERTRAASHQRMVLQETCAAIGPLNPHTLVVLEKPHFGWQQEAPTVKPFITGHAYEIEAILNLVYDKSVVGFVLQEPNDHERGKTSTAWAILNEQENFHDIVHYNFETKATTWLKKAPESPLEPLLIPEGPAWQFILRPQSFGW